MKVTSVILIYTRKSYRVALQYDCKFLILFLAKNIQSRERKILFYPWHLKEDD